MTIHSQSIPENGSVIHAPLCRLKASPRNARKTPHKAADIEALAASIRVKGLLQPLVVEPELDASGAATGYYLVTIGEGRRQAMLLRAKAKEIRKNEAVRCIVDVANDAYEISLDENVTRFAMHPADQFEAFQRLAEEQGWGPEEIAARFGVTPAVVRQRLRLARVSPRLMAVYREGGMTLDQLMAFTVTDDHARQESVWESLSWNKEPGLIRRTLTHDRVRASDRRAVFVGLEAYEAAGGVIERDLFAEDHGGYLTDPALLDRLALERLAAVADGLLGDGWKWAVPSLEAPQCFGMGRVYPKARDLLPEDQARYEQLVARYDALVSEHDDDEVFDEDVGARLSDLAGEIAALEGQRRGYDAEDMARSGAFVTIGHDGQVEVSAGFVRNEDRVVEPPVGDDEAEPSGRSAKRAASLLSDGLIADLTAHRTAALMDRLGGEADLALCAIVHALALQVFPEIDGGSCIEVSLRTTNLPAHAEGIRQSKALQGVEVRHAAWASALPRSSDLLWIAILEMDGPARLSLLAHCVSLSVNAVKVGSGRSPALAHADQLATALALDMRDYWTPTVDSYLGRVTKEHILSAVREGVSEEAAGRIDGLKKQPMAEAAEAALAETRWLPALLRTEPEASAPQVLQAAE